MTEDVQALIDARVKPALVLQAMKIPIAEIARRAEVSHTLAWRIANRPLDYVPERKRTDGEGTERVRRAIVEAVGFEFWPGEPKEEAS